MGLFPTKNEPRRELRKVDLAGRGLVAVVIGALVLALTFSLNAGAFSSDPEVTTVLRNVGGSLTAGSDVKMKGALVGKVTSIEESVGRVAVKITLDPEAIDSIPNNVTARVLPATVFGTAFVDLTASQPSGTSLVDGDAIQEDDSLPTIELQQALDDIDELVKALGPAELASAIGAIAQALDGRGEQIGSAIDRTTAFLAKVNPRMPLIRADLALLADNMVILQTYAPDLLTALDDLLVAAGTVVEQSAQITNLMAGGLTLVQHADAFLLEHEARFIRSIELASIVTDAVYDNRRAGIHDSFLANRNFADRGDPALRGSQLYLTLYARGINPPYYDSSDCPRYQGYGCSSARSTARLMGGSLLEKESAR